MKNMVSIIEYRIMGVPSRIGNIKLLQSQLGISDKETFIDTEYRRNPMWTWKQTVRLPMDKETTHLCVIQDDAVLPLHFKEFCNKIINKYPDAILNLYNYKNLDKKLPMGCIFTPNSNPGGVTMIIPVKYLDSIIEQQNKYYPNYIHDDNWISYWAYHNDVKLYCTYPSVVDTFKETEMNHKWKGMYKFCGDTLKYHWINATKFVLWKSNKWEELEWA